MFAARNEIIDLLFCAGDELSSARIPRTLPPPTTKPLLSGITCHPSKSTPKIKCVFVLGGRVVLVFVVEGAKQFFRKDLLGPLPVSLLAI